MAALTDDVRCRGQSGSRRSADDDRNEGPLLAQSSYSQLVMSASQYRSLDPGLAGGWYPFADYRMFPVGPLVVGPAAGVGVTEFVVAGCFALPG